MKIRLIALSIAIAAACMFLALNMDSSEGPEWHGKCMAVMWHHNEMGWSDRNIKESIGIYFRYLDRK